jgi:hypothetical protein
MNTQRTQHERNDLYLVCGRKKNWVTDDPVNRDHEAALVNRPWRMESAGEHQTSCARHQVPESRRKP